MIVAWHEVPGSTAPPKKAVRRVRYDSGRCAHRFEDWRDEISNAVSVSRSRETTRKCIDGVLDHVRDLVTLLPVISCVTITGGSYGAVLCVANSAQGLRRLAAISLSLREAAGHSPIEGRVESG